MKIAKENGLAQLGHLLNRLERSEEGISKRLGQMVLEEY
jgi:hypothetical protein